MLKIAFVVIEIALLIVLGVLLWQIGKFLRDKSIPDDEPLGEERVEYLTKRIDLLKITFIAMFIVQLLHIIWRIIKFLQ